MDSLLAVFLTTLPLIGGELYSRYEYGMSFRENFEKWRTAKIVAVVIGLSYYCFILSVGSAAIVFDIFDWVFFFFEFGIALSLIIYSKPMSESLENYISFRAVNLHEDVAFIIGWLLLLYIMFQVVIYAM
ncbi:hypothetical protein [Aliiglaciecola litoralis]|uniref:Uncharacterized protein n=1 Tax=Aliiglaciecola litoralis TaxID=582857 RepID=A0ABP3WTB5_9ALTE